MNWTLVSLSFLTGCMIGLSWVVLGILRAIVQMRAERLEDLRIVHKSMDSIMEHQIKIVENNQKSFQTIGDNMTKLTQLAAFMVEPHVREPEGKPK